MEKDKNKKLSFNLNSKNRNSSNNFPKINLGDLENKDNEKTNRSSNMRFLTIQSRNRSDSRNSEIRSVKSIFADNRSFNSDNPENLMLMQRLIDDYEGINIKLIFR